MQATHVRFALELEELIGIKNRNEYISGVMYPDSRYVSGIDRTHTHDYSLEPKDLLTGTDFEKGWKVHVIYDKFGGEILREIYHIGIIKKAFRDDWYKITGAKLFEDIESWKLMGDGVSWMLSVAVHACPNEESSKHICEWYNIQKQVYQNEPARLESYAPILDWYDDVDPEIKRRWLEEYDKILHDKKLAEEISKIYNKVLKQVHEGLKDTKN